jgi:peptidoglycan-associated lipoprotein
MRKEITMRANLASFITAIAAAVFIAGCGTTPEDKEASAAPVVDPTTGKPAAGKPAAQPQKVPGVDLTAKTDPTGVDPRVKAGALARRSIYYDLDQFDIKDEYRALVEAHAKFLRDNPSAKMLVQGNTDERGSREYNVGLGQRRSDGVKKMLVLLGAKDNQIESVSLGEEKPQAEGHDEAAWAKNRRSDMLYGGEY